MREWPATAVDAHQVDSASAVVVEGNRSSVWRPGREGVVTGSGRQPSACGAVGLDEVDHRPAEVPGEGDATSVRRPGRVRIDEEVTCQLSPSAPVRVNDADAAVTRIGDSRVCVESALVAVRRARGALEQERHEYSRQESE